LWQSAQPACDPTSMQITKSNVLHNMLVVVVLSNAAATTTIKNKISKTNMPQNSIIPLVLGELGM
ncbi:MAG TPA: hypothetical protein VF350_07555, partial [Candidatus Bathyarchaeia archaeon]